MLFVEPRFFVFFAIVFVLYWMMPWNRGRKSMLLIASYIFYGAWDWRFLSLIWLSTGFDFLVARKLESLESDRSRKRLMVASLCLNLGLLGFFKYFNFFTDSFEDLLALFGMVADPITLKILLPVGISFYTFQTLSYTIDVYRRRLPAEKSLLDFAFFVAFFPQLVAGPIVRAIDFLPQTHTRKYFGDVNVRACLLLFLVGFFKKACVSDNFAFYVDQVFDNPETYTNIAVIAATLLYGIQIYCDFSGYTDMAIACAGLLGYHLVPNFDAPYLSCSITDFWRRWHISLSTWLRDYLYIPLGGNRHGDLQRYRNLFLTMLLGGLWHGAAWTFVVWGGLHGAALSLNHLWKEKIKIALPAIIGWAMTFWFVHLCWIFFRAADIGTALSISARYMNLVQGGASTLPVNVYIGLAAVSALHILWRRAQAFDKIAHLPATAFTVFLALGSVIAASLIPAGYQPFIYFQF